MKSLTASSVAIDECLCHVCTQLALENNQNPPWLAPRKVNMLTAMGFSEQQAKDALDASGGDMESAVSW